MFRFRSSSRTVRHPRPQTFRPSLEVLEARLAPAVNVLSYHNDSASTGLNANEVQLTPANVQVGSFGKLSTTVVDGQVYAQPLVMTGVTIANGPNTVAGAAGVHDVVFVATEHDSLYAIDASATGGGAVLWQRSFLDLSSDDSLPGATSVTTVSTTDVGSVDISPEIGITGTPVIDASTNTLYLSVKTKETVAGVVHFVQRLHAINLGNGTDVVAPYVIGDTTGDNTNNTAIYVYGAGDGAVTDPYNGTGKQVVQFNALHEAERAALSLVNGEIYVDWASHSDNGPYHGWVAAWDVSNLATNGFVLKGVFNTSPNGGEAGIWQGAGRLAFEANGSAFYFVTGNGSVGPAITLNASGFPSNGDYYEAVVKVAADSTTSATHQNSNGWGFKAVDYFIPYDQPALDNADQDFGSGAPPLLPDSAGIPNHPHLLVAAGKEGKVYLIDRDNMGKYNSVNDNVLNAVPDGSGHNTPPVVLDGSLNTPAYYNGVIYWVAGYSGPAETFKINSNGTLTMTSQTQASFGYLPGSPSISANGTTNGIVWVEDRNANELHAYSTNSFATELWNSGQKQGGGDNLGAVVKFATPTVANGAVFVGTTNSLVIYGLTPPATAAPSAPVLSATALSGTAVDLTWSDPTTMPNTASGYYIEESSDGGATFQQVTTAPAGATALAVGGLTPGQTYSFFIQGFNGVGSGPDSNLVTASTPLNEGAVLDFSKGFTGSTSQLTYNGSAAIANGYGQLTDGGSNEAGSFFSTNPVDVTGFTSLFTFQINGGSQSADGFTFTIQGMGPKALGQYGGGLGYGPDATGGTGGIASSAAVKFDLYDNEGEGPDSTGLFTNGAAPTSAGSIDLTPSGIDLHSGDVFQVIMAYDGTTLGVTIQDTTTGKVATENYPVDIPALVGGSTAYVGFTGGTGGLSSTQDIQTWTYANNAVATQAPTAPSGLSATPASATSVTLTWNNGDVTQTGFDLDRATDPAFTQNLITETLPRSPSSFTDTATGLAPGGTYYYRLRAFNQAGSSASSNVAAVTIPLAPAKPTNAQVTGVSTNEIDLSWTDNAGRTATGYHVLRAANHGTFALVATLPAFNDPTPGTYTWSDTSVSPGTFYEYHIQTFNIAGNNDFTGTNATTLTLPPSGVVAGPGNNVVNLSWTAPTGAVTFNVYRGTSPGGENPTPLATGLTQPDLSDTTAVNGTTYSYTVTAVNGNVAPLPSESAASTEVSATPAAVLTSLNFSSGFANSNGPLTYNGSAAVNGSRGELTDGGGSEAGSILSSNRVDVSRFSTQFTFQVSPGSQIADGFTFCIQGVGATALGPSGGGLGYGPDNTTGSGGIPSSLAIKFDLYSNQGEVPDSTGLYLNGAAPTDIGSTSLYPYGLNLHSGDIFQVGMTYNGATLAVTIKDTKTGAKGTFNYNVNIPALVGGSSAFMGFTGGTGGLAAVQDILSWSYARLNPPTDPTGTRVTRVTSSEVDLRWTDNAGTSATGYHILRSVNNGPFVSYATLPGLTGTAPATYSWIDRSVVPGAHYQYQIAAYNLAGNSNFTSAGASTLTATPTTLSARGSNNSISFSWRAPAGAVAYNIYRGTTSGGESATPIAASLTQTTFTDTGLVNGQVYWYKITALNANLSPLADESLATQLDSVPTGPPPTPANLAASVPSNVGKATVKLTWTASPGALGYYVYRSTTSSGEGTAPLIWVSTSSFTDASAANGTTYFYKVVATSYYGLSARSSEVSATPLLSLHVNFTASSTVVPPGYFNDVGLPFGYHSNGLTYGWNVNNTGNMRIRNAAASPDALHDSLAQMESSNPNTWWGIALANGTYQVHLLGGDPDYIDTVYAINVSDGTASRGQLTPINPVLGLSGTPSLSSLWLENTVTMTISHGMLFLSNAVGSVNNKIDAIDIVQVSK